LPVNDNLEGITQAIFTEKFVSDSYGEEVPFTDVVQLMGGGTPQTDEHSYWNGTIPFFTPKDISLSPYCIKTEKTLSDEGLNACSSKLYPINTIFVTCRGTVGNVAMAGVPMAMNQSCYALKGKGKYPPLFTFCLTKYVISVLKHKASGAVFSALVTRDFEAEKIIKPDITKAINFESQISPIFSEILSNTIEIDRLGEVKEVILAALSK